MSSDEENWICLVSAAFQGQVHLVLAIYFGIVFSSSHLLLKPECYVVLKSMLYWIAHQIYALMVGSGKIARKTSLFRIKGIVIAGVRYYLFNMSHLLVTKGGLFAWI
jgi:hypothetical protein